MCVSKTFLFQATHRLTLLVALKRGLYSRVVVTLYGSSLLQFLVIAVMCFTSLRFLYTSDLHFELFQSDLLGHAVLFSWVQSRLQESSQHFYSMLCRIALHKLNKSFCNIVLFIHPVLLPAVDEGATDRRLADSSPTHACPSKELYAHLYCWLIFTSSQYSWTHKKSRVAYTWPWPKYICLHRAVQL